MEKLFEHADGLNLRSERKEGFHACWSKGRHERRPLSRGETQKLRFGVQKTKTSFLKILILTLLLVMQVWMRNN